MPHKLRRSTPISINSLGLPFVQLFAIDEAVRIAIKAEQHSATDLYMDKNFFLSLKLNDHEARPEWPRFPYQAPKTTGLSSYYLGGFDERTSEKIMANRANQGGGYQLRINETLRMEVDRNPTRRPSSTTRKRAAA